MPRPKNRDVPKNSSSPAAAASCAGAPGSRRGPLGYARDLAPARCRFRSTQRSPFGGTLLFLSTIKPGVSPRLVEPPPASRGPFRKRPCTERADAPRPARRPTEAYPPRYGEGGQRSRRGCSGTRMPGSEGMDPWRPAPRVPCAVPARRNSPGTFLIHLRDEGEECPRTRRGAP